MTTQQIEQQEKDLVEEYGYLRGDKFVVVYTDGHEETHKHTDIESVISSVSMKPLHHIHTSYSSRSTASATSTWTDSMSRTFGASSTGVSGQRP